MSKTAIVKFFDHRRKKENEKNGGTFSDRSSKVRAFKSKTGKNLNMSKHAKRDGNDEKTIKCSNRRYQADKANSQVGLLVGAGGH